MKRLRPFFRYYGSKHRLAPKYPTPRHDVVVEPFAGSAQYATSHYVKDVVLVESDPEIAALWAWLISAAPSDISSLPWDLEPYTDIRALDIPYGAQLLIRAWQRVGRSNCWTVSKWNNKNSGLWCKSTRDAIARQVQHIRHWRVLCGSVFEGRNGSDLGEATWFVDPPYQSQPTVYGNVAPDFRALGSWCRSLRGQVIVCEAPGADWLPFRELGLNTVGRTSQGGTRAKRAEMIWTSDIQHPAER